MVAPQILKALPRKNSQHVEPWNYSQSMSICAPDPGSKAVPQVPTRQYLCHHRGPCKLDPAPWLIPSARTAPLETRRSRGSQTTWASKTPTVLITLQTSTALAIEDPGNIHWCQCQLTELHRNYITGLFTESEPPHTPHLAPLYLPTSEGISPPKTLWKVWKFRLQTPSKVHILIQGYKKHEKSRKHDTHKRTQYFSV